jgi:hypothetical protein
MDDQIFGQLRDAYAQLAAGDHEGFAAMLDDEVHWQGWPRGLRRRQPY